LHHLVEDAERGAHYLTLWPYIHNHRLIELTA